MFKAFGARPPLAGIASAWVLAQISESALRQSHDDKLVPLKAKKSEWQDTWGAL